MYEKKAWLVVNEFLQSDKFTEIHDWLVSAASRMGIELRIKTNAELMVLPEKTEEPYFVLFWDKDVRLAWTLESLGYQVFNSAKAIEICDDKSLTYIVLQKAGLRMPKTMIAPMTYEGIGYTNYHFLEKVRGELEFPLIVKECFGSFGQQVYKVYSALELLDKVKEVGHKPLLFQENIQTSFARDLRLQVVGDRVVAAMYRYSESGDFRANISNGGKMKCFQPTEEQCQLAVNSCKAIGLDFAGVDILFGQEDRPLICEVNSNAHFKNIFDCTGVNVAEAILVHIAKRMEFEV